ncbi:MAG: hypothetical protein AB2990_02390 [Candidatus Symbiodolus clandestinus]
MTIETSTNEIEGELQTLKENFLKIIRNSTDQVNKNIKKTNFYRHFSNNLLFNPQSDYPINDIDPFSNPVSYVPQCSPQIGDPTCQKLTNALAYHRPQISHQASHSTTDQQYSSLSSDHSLAFRSEQFVSQNPQNNNSISDFVNISLSLPY